LAEGIINLILTLMLLESVRKENKVNVRKESVIPKVPYCEEFYLLGYENLKSYICALF
jgi:hypothetical protein